MAIQRNRLHALADVQLGSAIGTAIPWPRQLTPKIAKFVIREAFDFAEAPISWRHRIYEGVRAGGF
jgi:hypothetical protein